MTTMTDAVTDIPPCPTCGGPRSFETKPGRGSVGLYACTRCGEIESPLVGLQASEEPAPAAADEELLPPPDEDIDDPLPPPPEEELTASAEGAIEESRAIAQELVEILPADFPLPLLIKFAPDTRVRAQADVDAVKLLELQVTDATSQGVVEACLAKQREHKSTIELLFKEPCAIANNLHKHLTGLRGDWLARTDAAIKTAGERVLAYQRKVEREAAEQRRRDQEEADRQAREQLAREAEAARKADAPATVVQQLEREAKTAVAPPVATRLPLGGGGGLRSSTVAENWQPRLTATSRDAENWQPEMTQLSEAEQACVKTVMKAILEGREKLALFEINWSYVRARAKADKKTFAIEGFVAEDIGSLRAKPGARRK